LARDDCPELTEILDNHPPAISVSAHKTGGRWWNPASPYMPKPGRDPSEDAILLAHGHVVWTNEHGDGEVREIAPPPGTKSNPFGPSPNAYRALCIVPDCGWMSGACPDLSSAQTQLAAHLNNHPKCERCGQSASIPLPGGWLNFSGTDGGQHLVCPSCEPITATASKTGGWQQEPTDNVDYATHGPYGWLMKHTPPGVNKWDYLLSGGLSEAVYNQKAPPLAPIFENEQGVVLGITKPAWGIKGYKVIGYVAFCKHEGCPNPRLEQKDSLEGAKSALQQHAHTHQVGASKRAAECTCRSTDDYHADSCPLYPTDPPPRRP
jgi:hypothetical protein